MDVGRITSAKSAHLNDTSILYHSVRNPGFVYMFNLKRGKEYRCCRCKGLGKERTITVINGSVSTRKHPEDDHHPDCVPIEEAKAKATSLERQMRCQIRLKLYFLTEWMELVVTNGEKYYFCHEFRLLNLCGYRRKLHLLKTGFFVLRFWCK